MLIVRGFPAAAVAAAAAAVPTTTAAAAAAIAAATAAAATAGALLGLGHVNADGATVELRPVEGRNGLIGRLVILEGDKAETTRTTGVAVTDHTASLISP